MSTSSTVPENEIVNNDEVDEVKIMSDFSEHFGVFVIVALPVVSSYNRFSRA